MDRNFRFDCGATWLNLLATKGRSFSASPVERIDTPERLADWLGQCELTPARAPGQADLERTLLLRETLRPLALATIEEQPPPGEAVAELTRFLATPAAAAAPVRLLADGRLRREPPATVDEALTRIARQAVDQLTGPERLTLKICPEHDCRGVFADPADRRRWCPAPACASRGRVRAHRARRQAAPR